MAERGFGSLAEFAAHLSTLTVHTEHNQHEALERAAELVEHTAKKVIGTYDLQWAALSEFTKEDRVSKGFPADEPLLRTGQLRESIHHSVNMRGIIGSWNEARVGSNSDIAVWQELGFVNTRTGRSVPPRSFLMGSAIHKEEELRHILGAGALKGIVKQP